MKDIVKEVDKRFEELIDNPTGFYIDGGANNGIFLSKTKCLEDRGWGGICIEAQPNLYEELQQNRPGAVCVSCALSDTIDQVVTLTIDGRGVGGCSTILPVEEASPGIVVNKKVEVITSTLTKIICDNNVRYIDFLKIDVEGMDAIVLMGLDLNTVAVDIICYEQWPKLKDSQAYRDLDKKLTQASFTKIKPLGVSTKHFKPIDIVWQNNK